MVPLTEAWVERPVGLEHDVGDRDSLGQHVVHRQLEVKQLGVQPAHRDCGGAGGDGDPERAQHRTPVLLLDVLPAQVQPQLATAKAVDQPSTGLVRKVAASNTPSTKL